MKKIIAISLCLVMLVSTMMVSAFAEDYELMSDVYVSATGSDRAAGTQNAPTNNIVWAMSTVKDGGTIHIDGTIVLPEGFSFNKSVSIVGDNKATDILDLSAMPEGINLGGDTYFDGVTLKSSDYLIIAAYGHTLVVGENCATDGKIGIYGGGYKVAVYANTNVTLLSGKYTEAYGGGHLGSVVGNTHLTVGGSASVFNDINSGKASPYYMNYNIYGAGYGSKVEGSTYVVLSGDANRATCSFTESSHDSGVHYVFGGGYNCDITGSTNVRVTGNAIAHYVVGGMHGDPATFAGNIDGGSNVIMENGRVYGIYGASLRNDQNSDASIIVTGGTVSQIIGAGQGADHTGNVDIKLLGGQISRRIFGGCYNDWSFGWESSNYVKGTITLTIHGKDKLNINLNEGDDNALSAHSRRASVAGEEHGYVVFTSQTAQDDYLGKFNTGASLVGTGKPAYDSYSVGALLAGDVNFDGVVDVNDVMAVFRYVFDSSAYPLLDSSYADVNGDDQVTNADVLGIFEIIQ